MKLLCLTRYDRAGASSRYRTYQYIPRLRAAGIEVTEAPLLDHRYIARLYARSRQNPLHLARAAANRICHLLVSSRYDLVWLEKELFPFAPALLERLVRVTGTPFIVDFDDAIFHRYDQHRSALVRLAFRRKIDTVMRSATLVVAGNRYLAEHARAAGAQAVEILPTVIDLDRYPTRVAPKANEHLTIGWIGSPTTQAYLRDVAVPLAGFCGETGARVLAVGARPDFCLPGVPLDVVPWSESGEVPALQRFDIGIMPLPDEPFERGKCGFKLIQYMGCALPVIASPVGANKDIVLQGVTGFLADGPAHWIHALHTLGTSSALRSQLGLAGRARVECDYSLQSAAPRLSQLLRRVAEQPRKRGRE